MLVSMHMENYGQLLDPGELFFLNDLLTIFGKITARQLFYLSQEALFISKQKYLTSKLKQISL